MKKYALILIVGLMIFLAACNNSKSSEDKSTKLKSKKETVKIENSYKASGEKKDGSDAKSVKETVEVPKNPKNAIVFDYGALDTMKALGLEDKVKGLPKGEGNKLLPDFLSDFKDDKYINTGNLKEVNFDKLAEAKPEVIFISSRIANQKNLDEFKKAAPKAKVVYVGTDENYSVDSMRDSAKKLGQIYDKEDKIKDINKKLDDKIAGIKEKTEKLKDNKAMFLLVNEGELSTFGPGQRFGSAVFDTIGFKPVDNKIKSSKHGQNVTNEYVVEKNPNIIFAMDRGQVVSGKPTAKKTLSNDVIKNVDAVKNKKIIELEPKLWYFSTGSITVLIKQIDEVEKALDKK